MKKFILCILLSMFVGCINTGYYEYFYTKFENLPPTDVKNIKILSKKPERNFVEIGYIYSVLDNKPFTDRQIKSLKKLAAQMGADAIYNLKKMKSWKYTYERAKDTPFWSFTHTKKECFCIRATAIKYVSPSK